MVYTRQAAICAVCVVALVGVTPPARTHGQSFAYPATERVEVLDDYHGTTIADPYRWLEQLDAPLTLKWIAAQTRLTDRYLRRLPSRETIRRRLTARWNYKRVDVPWREAGQLFFTENSGLQLQPVFYTQRSPDEVPRVVLDPQEISRDGSIAIGDFAVSPDGRWLAYSQSRGGADTGATHVRNLSTGRALPDGVEGTWGTACWTEDGGGFFYMRPQPSQPGAAANGARLRKQSFYHTLGRPQSEDRLIHEWTDYQWVYCMLSDDGRRAIIVGERGPTATVAVIDLGSPKAPNIGAPFVQLMSDHEAGYTPMGTVEDTLYLVTDLDAPRGRIVAVNLTEGAAAQPRTVVAESNDVIQRATVAGDRLAVSYLTDVKGHLRLFMLNGEPDGEVPLPGVGAVGSSLNGRHSASELLYSFTSFLSPTTVYRYDLPTRKNAPFRAPRIAFDADNYVTNQVFYASKDGTAVPMFVTARRDLPRDGTNAVLLTAYGGYGSVLSPRFGPEVVTWLEMGGVYAAANIRGGGEYGETWHRNGSREHKQNSFDDFIAAAEYLIAQRYTAPAKLAIYGHSNGGLLIGAAITQRPELFAVAFANAGHYDMLRYHKFTVGAGWIAEYGSPDSAIDFRYLRTYSPLHNVRPRTCYPATLLLAADHDDRVVPSHAYKFAATLQAAQACDRPILLRVARDASHSYASASAAIAEMTDMWAFAAARMGMSVR